MPFILYKIDPIILHRKDRIMFRFLSTLAIIASTYAYRQDLAKLPNGNSYGLTLGHPGGNTKVPTKLASSFYAAGQTWNKAFCMADADGDGQSNGLEMGDPCCRWSIGQTPQFTTGLSDPNSAASTSMNKMPSCIMVNEIMNTEEKANPKLQCAVCTQALQLDQAKPSDNAAEFSLISVKSCKDATQDDNQKVLCVAALIKNADQLLMDQKNGVTPIQSCMNLGLMCMVPPTTAPTKAPTAAPTTAAPTTTAPTTVAPATVAPTTAAPTTVAPATVAPTTAAPKPTAPPPPRKNAITTEVATQSNQATETTESAIIVPVAVSAGIALVLTLAAWRHYTNKKEQEALLQPSDDDFHVMPDIVYSH